MLNDEKSSEVDVISHKNNFDDYDSVVNGMIRTLQQQFYLMLVAL